MVEISTLGIATQSILQIRNAQEQINLLSNQLATGKRSLNYADYSLSEGRHILDFRNVISQREAYLDTINTLKPRLDVYDKTFDQLDTVANQALNLVNSVQNPGDLETLAVGPQIKTFLEQTQYLLNQKVGDRYIFSGTRFTTAPVGNVTALPVPPTDSSTPVSSPTLPTYDSQAPGSDATAYALDTTQIDNGYTISTGVTSNADGFQKLILGLRWAYAASQDPSNYSTYMATARTLISGAQSDMRGLHGTVVANLQRVNDVKKLHNQFISEAKTQIDTIQSVDSAEVATKITLAQSQLQASYSVTAKVTSLSLSDYL